MASEKQLTKPSSRNPQFSFIIPVLNGERTLAGTLSSIGNQTHRNFEVIVVDNGSTDRTREIAKTFSAVRYTYLGKKNRSLARNRGAALAQGEYLAFIDADVVLAADWLDRARQYMARQSLDALATQVMPAQEGKSVLDAYRWEAARWKSKGTFLSVLFSGTPCALINTAACIVTKASFVQVGGFNPQLKRHEDLELSRRLFARGYFLGGASSAHARVRFVSDKAIPLARELSYLWRAGEVQYFSPGNKSARLRVRWPFLKSLSERRPLLSYAMLVELAGCVGQAGKLLRTKDQNPSGEKIGRKNTLPLTFRQGKKMHFLRRNVNFIFIDGEVFMHEGFGQWRRLGIRTAEAIRKLSREDEISVFEKRVLLELGAFRTIALPS